MNSSIWFWVSIGLTLFNAVMAMVCFAVPALADNGSLFVFNAGLSFVAATMHYLTPSR